MHEPVLIKPLKQISVSQALFKVTSFIDLGPYLESLNSFKKYIEWLKKPLRDIVRNPNYRFLEQNSSIAIHNTVLIGVGVLYHYWFHTMFLQTNEKILYLKRIFQNMHSGFLDALDHPWNDPASVDDTETTAQELPLVRTIQKEVLFPD